MGIEPKETQLVDATEVDKLVAFRDDLRAPKVVFGRSAITGEWGKCVALDLGDICFQVPDTEKGVEIEDDQIRFTIWKPAVFQNQVTLSEAGLRKILQWAENQENPIPGVTPELVYKWQATYADGSAVSQFRFENEEEVEINSNQIDFTRIAQFSVTPRFTTEEELPTYTFVRGTGKFYRGGVEIDTMYDGPYFPEGDTVYFRKVALTYGSGIGIHLDRQIMAIHSTVLQVIGWRIGGLQAVIDRLPTPGCLIAIDERGNWRPYDYTFEQ